MGYLQPKAATGPLVEQITQHAEFYLITRNVLRLVDKIEPIVSCCVPCSTKRDGVQTPESVVHTVLLGIRIVRWFDHYIHRPSLQCTSKPPVRYICELISPISGLLPHRCSLHKRSTVWPPPPRDTPTLPFPATDVTSTKPTWRMRVLLAGCTWGYVTSTTQNRWCVHGCQIGQSWIKCNKSGDFSYPPTKI